jgi:hypothetical protein
VASGQPWGVLLKLEITTTLLLLVVGQTKKKIARLSKLFTPRQPNTNSGEDLLLFERLNEPSSPQVVAGVAPLAQK